ncbi:hypothetical protein BG004_007238 [Podila humilis]|nr:hypothetical protein BG004_007238 [Podila humilis]
MMGQVRRCYSGQEFKVPVALQPPAADAFADFAAWKTANVEITDALTEDVLEEVEEMEEVEEAEEAHH